jgi:hypothetical protein
MTREDNTPSPKTKLNSHALARMDPTNIKAGSEGQGEDSASVKKEYFHIYFFIRPSSNKLTLPLHLQQC